MNSQGKHIKRISLLTFVTFALSALSLDARPEAGFQYKQSGKSRYVKSTYQGYLKHMRPIAVRFGVTPLPFDRNTIVPELSFRGIPAIDIVDETFNTTPDGVDTTMSTGVFDNPYADGGLNQLSADVSVSNEGNYQDSANTDLINSDDLLYFYEGNDAGTSKLKVEVPFELPYTSTPSTPVLRGNAAYKQE